MILRGDQQRRPGVFQHHPQAVVRVAGVQRQPGGPRFDNAVQRQGQEHRARQGHRHAVPRLHAALTQQLRERHHLLTHLAIAELPAGVRQRRGIRGLPRLVGHQRAEGGGRQRHSGIVDRRQPGQLVGGEHLCFAAAQRRIGGELRQQRGQSRHVATELGFVVPGLVGEDLQRQPAGLIREQRQLEIVDRAGGEGVGHCLHTIDIQLVIKDFDVQHRAEQRFVPCRFAAVANDLFGVIALMAAHLFQLSGEAHRQVRQRLLGVNMHRQRQDIEHRPRRGQRG